MWRGRKRGVILIGQQGSYVLAITFNIYDSNTDWSGGGGTELIN